MKKFDFKLERILDIRSKLEQEQKNKLSLAASEYQKVLQKKTNALAKVNTSRQLINQQIKQNNISILQLQQLDFFQNKINLLTIALEPKIEEKKQIMEKEKQLYNKLHKDKRAIEILKEHALKKHKLLALKDESMQMEEIAKAFSHNINSFYEK